MGETQFEKPPELHSADVVNDDQIIYSCQAASNIMSEIMQINVPDELELKPFNCNAQA